MLVPKSSNSIINQFSNHGELRLSSKLDIFVKRGIGKLIGNTPLLDLSHLIENNSEIKLLAKTEFMNPGGSVKDRAALNIIKTAIETGELTDRKSVG